MDLLLQMELTLFQFDGTLKSSLHSLKNTLSLLTLMTEFEFTLMESSKLIDGTNAVHNRLLLLSSLLESFMTFKLTIKKSKEKLEFNCFGALYLFQKKLFQLCFFISLNMLMLLPIKSLS